MKNFTINGKRFKAERSIEGILINPELPKNFHCIPNNTRPLSHQKWWDVPYITTTTIEENDELYKESQQTKEWIKERHENFLKAWPEGVRYEVQCLDGGAWDRPTGWGMFASLEEAINCVKA